MRSQRTVEETKRLFEAGDEWENDEISSRPGDCPDASCPCHFELPGAEASVTDAVGHIALTVVGVLLGLVAVLVALQFGRP